MPVFAVAATNPVVKMYGVEYVQHLPLVLVDSFHLDVEHHVRGYAQTRLVFNVVSKMLLVRKLYCTPA